MGHGGQVLLRSATASGESKEAGKYALASILHDFAAQGSKPMEADIHIMLPEYTFQSRIHRTRKYMEKMCVKQGIKSHSIVVEKTPAVSLPMVHISGAGETINKREGMVTPSPGWEIIFTKWAGMAGMLRAVQEMEEVLCQHFSASFLYQIKSFEKFLFEAKEIEVALENKQTVVRQIKDGGVFAALWNLSQEFDTGLSVTLQKIPILQETIEVCECLGLNPYQLTSVGSFFILAPNAKEIVSQIRKMGVCAQIIGTLTDNRDKIIRSGEDVRYVDRPAGDEFYKILRSKERRI